MTEKPQTKVEAWKTLMKNDYEAEGDAIRGCVGWEGTNSWCLALCNHICWPNRCRGHHPDKAWLPKSDRPLCSVIKKITDVLTVPAISSSNTTTTTTTTTNCNSNNNSTKNSSTSNNSFIWCTTSSRWCFTKVRLPSSATGVRWTVHRRTNKSTATCFHRRSATATSILPARRRLQRRRPTASVSNASSFPITRRTTATGTGVGATTRRPSGRARSDASTIWSWSNAFWNWVARITSCVLS